MYDSPSAFAKWCLRTVSPDRKEVNGWTSVIYQGRLLDTYRTVAEPEVPGAGVCLPCCARAAVMQRILTAPCPILSSRAFLCPCTRSRSCPWSLTIHRQSRASHSWQPCQHTAPSETLTLTGADQAAPAAKRQRKENKVRPWPPEPESPQPNLKVKLMLPRPRPATGVPILQLPEGVLDLVLSHLNPKSLHTLSMVHARPWPGCGLELSSCLGLHPLPMSAATSGLCPWIWSLLGGSDEQQPGPCIKHAGLLPACLHPGQDRCLPGGEGQPASLQKHHRHSIRPHRRRSPSQPQGFSEPPATFCRRPGLLQICRSASARLQASTALGQKCDPCFQRVCGDHSWAPPRRGSGPSADLPWASRLPWRHLFLQHACR